MIVGVDSTVGTAKAIEQSKLRNIFRKEDRRDQLLTSRQIEAMKNAIKNTNADCRDTVDIMAISGRFYFAYPASDSMRELGRDTKVRVRVAVVNPTSQQAILRAIADTVAPDKVEEGLHSWDWEQHRKTDLYRDVEHTIGAVERWHGDGINNIDLRLYSSSLACALLLTAEGSFIEQYLYGRSEAFAKGRHLGGEYPVMEYRTKTDTDEPGGVHVLLSEAGEPVEEEILTTTFEIVWRSFSVGANEFKHVNHEEEFNRNLTRLREELSCGRSSK
jgi:hypothetical protein